MTNYKVREGLFLVQQTVSKESAQAPAKLPPVHHLLILDCSGSMTWDLPKMRYQLKKKLPKMLGEKDVVSIIWFSGIGEFGTLLEAEPVAILKDLAQVYAAIDRWLKPIGLTGFLQPIQEAERVVDRVAKKLPTHIVSLMFLSDGMDNCSHKPDILSAVQKIASKLSSATFVEYGYYADRPLLVRMAEKTGGCLIFAEDFDRYAPTFERAIQKKLTGVPRIELEIPGDVIGGFAYALFDGDFLTFSVEDGKVLVPQNLTEVWYISSVPVGPVTPRKDLHDPVYAGISLYAQRMNSDVVTALLKKSGDVRLINRFSGCFGKQKYSEFVEDAQKAAFDPKVRLVEGYDPDLVPPEDAFTVLELLQILAEDEGNRILIDHPAFKYKRIGRASVDSNEVVTKSDQQKVADIAKRASETKDPKELQKIAFELAALSDKPKALKFKADSSPNGYSVSDLVFNEDRPNVSLRVKKHGKVNLSGHLPEGAKILEEDFQTFIYRNYTIIRDGIVNIDVLPVKLTDGSIRKILNRTPNILTGEEDSNCILLNLRTLPVINRKMVREASAKTLFELSYHLVKAQADQKVYNTVMKQAFPKESVSFAARYGAETAEWLKEQGITDYNGFNPKTVQAEATDFYMGKELKVSLKGLSSLPSLADVNKRRASGKLTDSASLMVPAIEKLENFQASDAYTEAPNKPDLLKAWLEGRQMVARQQVRALLFQISQIQFSIVVGQIWPEEFSSLDEDTLTIEVEGKKILGKLSMNEVKVQI